MAAGVRQRSHSSPRPGGPSPTCRHSTRSRQIALIACQPHPLVTHRMGPTRLGNKLSTQRRSSSGPVRLFNQSLLRHPPCGAVLCNLSLSSRAWSCEDPSSSPLPELLPTGESLLAVQRLSGSANCKAQPCACKWPRRAFDFGACVQECSPAVLHTLDCYLWLLSPHLVGWQTFKRWRTTIWPFSPSPPHLKPHLAVGEHSCRGALCRPYACADSCHAMLDAAP